MFNLFSYLHEVYAKSVSSLQLPLLIHQSVLKFSIVLHHYDPHQVLFTTRQRGRVERNTRGRDKLARDIEFTHLLPLDSNFPSTTLPLTSILVVRHLGTHWICVENNVTEIGNVKERGNSTF